MNVKELGNDLYLDSGTLTPLLKKLESKGYINRDRMKEDERNLRICITPKGEELRDVALKVPNLMSQCISLNPEEFRLLYQLLYKVIGKLSD